MRQFRPLPVCSCSLLAAADRRVQRPVVFLISPGTWTGTVTIAVNPGDPGASAPTSGPITLTFEEVPQTNLQTFSDDRSVAARLAASDDHREHGAGPR